MSQRQTLGLLAKSGRKALIGLAILILGVCALYHLAQPPLGSHYVAISQDTGYSDLLWMGILILAILSPFFLIGKPKGDNHDFHHAQR